MSSSSTASSSVSPCKEYDLDSTELVGSVVVVGSANLDLVVHAERAPLPGETVLGYRLTEHPGGKGLNQAIASAAYAPTALVGAVGRDRAGGVLRTALTESGVDLDRLRTPEGASGMAVVNVAADGENSITVISGVNDMLTRDDTLSALDALQPRVVVTQLETPLPTVVAAARWAEAHSSRWVFNPSPLDRLLDADHADEIHDVLPLADPLIVNAAEGRKLLGAPDDTTPQHVARDLARSVTSVVVTDGGRGAWVGNAENLVLVPAPVVKAVDTTGAGDSFAGTMAALLAVGSRLEAAATAATAAAAVVVSTSRADR